LFVKIGERIPHCKNLLLADAVFFLLLFDLTTEYMIVPRETFSSNQTGQN